MWEWFHRILQSPVTPITLVFGAFVAIMTWPLYGAAFELRAIRRKQTVPIYTEAQLEAEVRRRLRDEERRQFDQRMAAPEPELTPVVVPVAEEPPKPRKRKVRKPGPTAWERLTREDDSD